MTTITLQIPASPAIMRETAKWLNDEALKLDGNSTATLAPISDKKIEAAANAATEEKIETPASTGDVQLDADGLPWDARIHSGNKTQTQAGAWKKKKGVDAETVKAVEAELKAIMNVSAETETASDDEDDAGNFVPPVLTAALKPPAPAPSAPVWDGSPRQRANGIWEAKTAEGEIIISSDGQAWDFEKAPTVNFDTTAPADFGNLAQRLATIFSDHPEAQVLVDETLKEMSLPNLPAIATRPDLIPSFWEKFVAKVTIKIGG